MHSTNSAIRLVALACVTLLVSAGRGGGQNLVVNGDFEAGNTGFISEYVYSPALNTDAPEYTIRTVPFPWNGEFLSNGDHTTGAGNMFVGNGDATPNRTVWQSATPVTVQPNTQYYFEAWATNVCCHEFHVGPNSPALLQFLVAGLSVESVGTLPTHLPGGGWEFLGTTWNSGANTSVLLRIVNQNTLLDGNDFALDDIHFGTATSLPEPGTAVLACWLVSCLPHLRRRPR